MVAADDGRVIGELLTLHDPLAAIRRLDHLEDFRRDGPQHYERVVVTAHSLDGGDPVRAWCYAYNWSRLLRVEGARRIPAGTWK